MPRPLRNDLTGQRYGRLVVVSRAPNDRTNHVQWFCTCDCGNTSTVRSMDLIFGKVKSCSCYKSDRQKEISAIRKKPQ